MPRQPTLWKRIAFAFVAGPVKVVCLAVLIGFVLSVFYSFTTPWRRPKEYPRRASCQSNLKQIALAHMQYSQDYDERMPLVNMHDAAISPQHPLGWADGLQPYLNSTEPYQCPSQADNGTARQPNETGYTDYWYNARLAGVEASAIRHPANVLLHGEGNDSTDVTNARYSLSELPAAWHNAGAPAMRHLDGANYSYVDGHVKWSKPQAMTIRKPDGQNLTFSVR